VLRRRPTHFRPTSRGAAPGPSGTRIRARARFGAFSATAQWQGEQKEWQSGDGFERLHRNCLPDDGRCRPKWQELLVTAARTAENTPERFGGSSCTRLLATKPSPPACGIEGSPKVPAAPTSPITKRFEAHTKPWAQVWSSQNWGALHSDLAQNRKLFQSSSQAIGPARCRSERAPSRARTPLQKEVAAFRRG